MAVSMLPGWVVPALLTNAVTSYCALTCCASARVWSSRVKSAWNDTSFGCDQAGPAWSIFTTCRPAASRA